MNSFELIEYFFDYLNESGVKGGVSIIVFVIFFLNFIINLFIFFIKY